MRRSTQYLDHLVDFVSGKLSWKQLLERVDEQLAQSERLNDSEHECALSSLELMLHEVAEQERESIEAYILALRILEQMGKAPVSDRQPSRRDLVQGTDLFVFQEYDLNPDTNTSPIAEDLAPGPVR